ncbi:helix-turn-helix domain-containing protein [Lactococcus carnosus]|uniref:helix-turn-helix domain-containing protein n=1 Tax=Pseudolactococcus carnosus TaxID=2749961 RepID=UPI0030B90B3C
MDKAMNKTQLRDTAGISGNVIAKLGKNAPVALASLIKIAETLGVDIGDIISLEQSNIKK